MRALLVALLALSGCDSGEERTRVTVRAAEPSPTEPDIGEPPVVEPEPVAEAAPPGPPPEVAEPYDDAADAEREIDQALARARARDKRVLVVFGANWCSWCRRLEHVLQSHPAVSRALTDGFEVVHVSTGARRSGKNAAINARYGDPIQHGLPVFVVLDGTGEIVMTQETGSLEVDDRHDPEKVLAFLARAQD